MTGIPTQDLTALLDALVGDDLRRDPDDLTRKLNEGSIVSIPIELTPQHIATLARIAAGENYEHRIVTLRRRDTPNPMPCITTHATTSAAEAAASCGLPVTEFVTRAIATERWLLNHAGEKGIWNHPDGRSFMVHTFLLGADRYASNEARPHPDPCLIPDCPVHPTPTGDTPS